MTSIGLGWLAITLVLCWTDRWRAAVIANTAAIVGVPVGCVALIVYYAGKTAPDGSFVIEGPEFFGAVLLTMLIAIWAGVSLVLGAFVIWIRGVARRRAEMEPK